MWWKNIILQRLHRNYFARALAENPRDPMRSRFARSFQATFESSKILLELAITGFNAVQKFFLRLHTVWANALVSSVSSSYVDLGSELALTSAQVVMSAVACRVTEGTFAAQALDYLDRMVNLFEEAKAHPIAYHGQVTSPNIIRLSRIVTFMSIRTI